MKNLSEMLKQPEKNLVNFPLKELPNNLLCFREYLENPKIKESLTEEQVKLIKEKVIVKLLNRMITLNEINQKEVSQ